LLLGLGANQAAVMIQLKRAQNTLREADRRKDEFLATLAHELRNPLAPIGNALQIMELTGDNREVMEEARHPTPTGAPPRPVGGAYWLGARGRPAPLPCGRIQLSPDETGRPRHLGKPI
jgi:signal transduction histidine kinase